MELTPEDRRGLDEIRRLLTTAWVAHCRKEQCSSELVATICHALRYHHPYVMAKDERLVLFQALYYRAPGEQVPSPVGGAIDVINALLGDDGELDGC